MRFGKELTINEAIKILRNEQCPHQRRIACSTCEQEDICNAIEVILDYIEDNCE